MFHLRVEIQRGEDRRSSPLSAAYASATAYFPDIMSRDTRTTTKYVPDEGRLFKDTPKDTRALLLNEPPPPPPLSPPPLEKPFPREIITYYASRPRYVSFENFAEKGRERERKEGRKDDGGPSSRRVTKLVPSPSARRGIPGQPGLRVDSYASTYPITRGNDLNVSGDGLTRGVSYIIQLSV